MENQVVPQNIAPTPLPEKKSSGSLVAVIIILCLIIVGGLYFLNQRMNRQIPSLENIDDSDSVTAGLEMQSTSDEVDTIEADLNATNFDNLDEGSESLEAEAQL